jgi:hypothetical protein
MSAASIQEPASVWKNNEKIAFRVFFIYFLIQALPFDGKFFSDLFSINWSRLYYGDIFNLVHYEPRFSSGPASYADWGIIALIAVAGTAIWTWLDRRRTEYNILYYWLRVILRYRLAIAVIGYGFIKLFPLQSPYPSISNLNTQYGDFTRWKLFSLSLGIVPSYESFLGLVEIISGLLLLFRKTATTGALFIFIFLGNVFMSNLAYGGGEEVYSLYLISIALFLLAFDIQRLISLLILQKPTLPNRFRPVLAEKWRYIRLALKTVFILFFIVLYGFSTRSGYHHDPYQFPLAKGLPGTSGIYNVTEFRINKDSLPYSKTDPVRWQDLVFEKWATISIRSNRPVIPDSNNIDRISAAEKDRTYELEGSVGRHYYSYEYDTLNHLLKLQNKNKHYSTEQWVLHYSRPQDSTIILSGTNENKDSVYVVLNKINKKYLLEEVSRLGRQKPLKL